MARLVTFALLDTSVLQDLQPKNLVTLVLTETLLVLPLTQNVQLVLTVSSVMPEV